jgi:hypothetical protein
VKPGPYRSKTGRKINVVFEALPNTATKRQQRACHERKHPYATMAEAEVDIPPTQSPYLCPWGDHWHRVTRRS